MARKSWETSHLGEKIRAAVMASVTLGPPLGVALALVRVPHEFLSHLAHHVLALSLSLIGWLSPLASKLLQPASQPVAAQNVRSELGLPRSQVLGNCGWGVWG